MRRFCVSRLISFAAQSISPHRKPTASDPRSPVQRKSKKASRSTSADLRSLESWSAEKGCAPDSGRVSWSSFHSHRVAIEEVAFNSMTKDAVQDGSVEYETRATA